MSESLTDEQQLQIENDVPVPGGGKMSPATRAIRALEPGQSVLIPDGMLKDVCATVGQLQRILKRKFTTRKAENGRRVWRLS